MDAYPSELLQLDPLLIGHPPFEPSNATGDCRDRVGIASAKRNPPKQLLERHRRLAVERLRVDEIRLGHSHSIHEDVSIF